MLSKIFVLLCALSAILAYPYEYQQMDLSTRDEEVPYIENNDLQHQRLKRQLNVQGGGSPGQGVDFNINARVPVWQSDNGRHSFDATGQYGQHLGGPYGNSDPSWQTGGVYTFRF